jgi:hypothetical protein
VRDGRVVDEDVEAAEVPADAFGRRGDRVRIRDVELKSVSVGSDALRGRLALLEVARPDEHGEAVLRQLLCDLQADSLVGSGDQGDGLGFHRASFVRGGPGTL